MLWQNQPNQVREPRSHLSKFSRSLPVFLVVVGAARV